MLSSLRKVFPDYYHNHYHHHHHHWFSDCGEHISNSSSINHYQISSADEHFFNLHLLVSRLAHHFHFTEPSLHNGATSKTSAAHLSISFSGGGGDSDHHLNFSPGQWPHVKPSSRLSLHNADQTVFLRRVFPWPRDRLRR